MARAFLFAFLLVIPGIFSACMRPDPRYFVDSLQDEKLIEYLFPQGTYKNGLYAWRPPDSISSRYPQQLSDDSLYHTRRDTVLAFPHELYCVLFTTAAYYRGEKDACHGCRVLIGMAAYRKHDRQYELLNFDPVVFESGAYGERGKISVAQLGAFPTVLESSGWTGTGQELETHTYYDPEDFREILSVDVFSSNGGFFEQTDSNYRETRRMVLVPGHERVIVLEQEKYWKPGKGFIQDSGQVVYTWDLGARKLKEQED